MNDDKYADMKIFGAAIKYTGDILKPFLADHEDLKRQVEAIKNEQDMTAWYPLTTIISLFEIAEKNDFLERLAPVIVVERPFAVTSPAYLIAPIWNKSPAQVTDDIVKKLEHRDSRQGRLCEGK